MRNSTTTPCVLFPELFDRPLTALFDVPNASSDGGAVLLKAADRRLGLIARLAEALDDDRVAGKVRHGLEDLLGQRIYGLALGYEDANDAARLADDPMHKLLLGRGPSWLNSSSRSVSAACSARGTRWMSAKKRMFSRTVRSP